MKKKIVSVLALSLLLSSSTTAFASTQYTYNNTPTAKVSTNATMFIDDDYNNIETQSSSSSGGSKWYYNTGTSIPKNATPSYSKYKLLSNVQVGDIVYEAAGGFGITGHAAIVEGKYYDSSKGMYYIRIIEAGEFGVARSILDDTRIDEKEATIYRVSGATSTQKQNAVNFCKGELGSSYFLDFAHDTSSSETDWYCSELVWAAYKNQGIDIETTGKLNEPGITPRDIARSSKVTKVSI